MSGVSKLTADRNQRILLDLVSKPGNDVCADCKARAPRWASHNLGIFICMNCASIHRKIGTHITKVKSVTMDSWSREQVEVMKSTGNAASNAKYNPNEARHPPPANREESERDSELEKFIRWKYEFKRFMDKSANQPPASSLRAPPPRAHSTPATTVARQSSPLPPLPTNQTSRLPLPSRQPEPHSYSATPAAAAPSHSQPSAPAFSSSAPPVPAPVLPQSAPNSTSSHPVWNDMMSLSTQSVSPMAPQSQMQPPQPQFQQPSFTSSGNSTTSFGTPSPTNPFPSNFINCSPTRTASLTVPAGVGPPFQTQNPQHSMGNPFGMHQQSARFPGQMNMAGTPFQSTPTGAMQVQSPFGQPSPSPSPFSHSYTPPSSFPQQQQQQQFAPSSFPQQFAHPSHSPMQQPQQGFPQQPQAQGGNPFGAPMQWQQQQTGFSGQPQHGQWGGM